MQATTGGTRVGPERGHELVDGRRRGERDRRRRAATAARCSSRRPAPAPCGRPRPRRPSQPAARSPSGSTSRATAARASSTRHRRRRGRGKRVEQRLGHEPLGHQVGARCCRPPAPRRCPGRWRRPGTPAEGAGVGAARSSSRRGPVGRRHHHPVVARRAGPRPSARAAPPSAGSATSMTGTSTGSAPSRPQRRGAARRPGARARVTTTRCAEQRSATRTSRGPAPATSPMTMRSTARPAAWSARVASVARTVCCSGRVPQRTAAAGVSGGEPAGDEPARRSAAGGRRPSG